MTKNHQKGPILRKWEQTINKSHQETSQVALQANFWRECQELRFNQSAIYPRNTKRAKIPNCDHRTYGEKTLKQNPR